MMVRECTSSCYVLFWIVAVPASGPKDLFVERETCNHVNRVKHKANMGRLSQVAYYFPVS
jgi:hypothetical protein